MLHSERKNYQKKISKLNKDFPSGFKTIDFRMLHDMIKHEIISNKISQMETPEFEEICSMLNFTPEDIQREKQQLEDYLDTLSIKMENTPFKEEKDYDRIKQTESDGLLFNEHSSFIFSSIYIYLKCSLQKKLEILTASVKCVIR